MRRKTSACIASLLLGAQFAQSPAFAQRYGGTVRGPRGGAAQTVTGPRGTATRGVTPSGRTYQHARGPTGSATAVQGPQGRAYASTRYTYGGHNYYRPTWSANQVNVYSRGFVGYPGYRSYGTYYGLTPGLAAFSSLAFLSAGMLVASYAHQDRTVYVYVVNEGGRNVEYRVDSAGNVISQRPV
jgi:hypothetical protein